MPTARQWIDHLRLEPHPEGGWYREVYRSDDRIPSDALPARYDGDRAVATSIYFLLEGGQFSAFHRLASDELWFLHAGGPLRVWILDAAGTKSEVVLGTDAVAGQSPQVAIPRDTWFAARPEPGADYALIGCVVAPGFEFADFELASRDALAARFPQHAALIRELTR